MINVLVLAVASLGADSTGAAQARSLGEILDRAGAYVQDYHRRITTVIAEEHYVQRSMPVTAGEPRRDAPETSEERTLRSDFMLLPGFADEDVWFAFRDVYEVDGKPVSSERGRLERWLADSRSGFLHRARTLALEQARYNIGPVVRTINVPTLALEILMRANQERFRFRRTGATVIAGVPVAVVTFEERRRRTMIRTPEGEDVAARGTLWIEAATGGVMRTELRTGERRRGQVEAAISVTYALVPRLETLLPETMTEEYVAAGKVRIECTATYSNYRRFEAEARIVR